MAAVLCCQASTELVVDNDKEYNKENIISDKSVEYDDVETRKCHRKEASLFIRWSRIREEEQSGETGNIFCAFLQ